jgi:hypothetical protein
MCIVRPHVLTSFHEKLFNQDLLLLLQFVNELNRYLEYLRHNVRRRKSQPLGQRNVSHTVRLVDFNPDKVLIANVLNVVA